MKRGKILKLWIKVWMPGYHLQKNGSGRKKKVIDPMTDPISNEYQNSHLKRNFPEKNMED